MTKKTAEVHALACNFCEDIIWSKYRHDYVTCSCGEYSIDGGQCDYVRIAFKRQPDYVTGIYNPKTKKFKPWLKYEVIAK